MLSPLMQLPIFFFLALTPVLINYFVAEHKGKHTDAFWLSVAFCGIWTASIVFWAITGSPESEALNPPMDLVGAWLAIVSFFRRPVVWKLFLATAFLFQVLLGGTFWLTWQFHHMTLETNSEIFNNYKWYNGYIWLCELLILSLAGGYHALARTFSSVIYNWSRIVSSMVRRQTNNQEKKR